MLPKISVIKREVCLVEIKEIISKEIAHISVKNEDVDINFLQNEWIKIVGEKIAEVSKPIKINGTKLRIKINSPTWKIELVYQKNEILKRIQEHVGSEKIRDISFM